MVLLFLFTLPLRSRRPPHFPNLIGDQHHFLSYQFEKKSSQKIKQYYILVKCVSPFNFEIPINKNEQIYCFENLRDGITNVKKLFDLVMKQYKGQWNVSNIYYSKTFWLVLLAPWDKYYCHKYKVYEIFFKRMLLCVSLVADWTALSQKLCCYSTLHPK